MFSVTQRVKHVGQPNNGYVPKSLFDITTYDDKLDLYDIKSSLSSIQGLAVDYLLRFLCTHDKFKSFFSCICGAMHLDEVSGDTYEWDYVKDCLNNINGLDDESILNVCCIVRYDAIHRTSSTTFRPSHDVAFDVNLCKNIFVLVSRCLSFFNKNNLEIIETGFTFEDGYTELVSSGDGDYLTQDMILDIKCSTKSFSTQWSLQLLMYYILGIHSVYSEFLSIKKLCIFNPCENVSYICVIENIPDSIKYNVSHSVLGYNMLYDDFSKWMDVNGSDMNLIRKFSSSVSIDVFDVNNYDDGIFDISITQYWQYICSHICEYHDSYNLQPAFKNIKSINFIKHGPYYMFVSVSDKDRYCLLQGGRRHKLYHSLDYYYENLVSYCSIVQDKLSVYWNILKQIRKKIVSMKSDINEKPIGRIHGCIIDIDNFNHIFVSVDFKYICFYYAQLNYYDVKFYDSLYDLLFANRPDLLSSNLNMLSDMQEYGKKSFCIDSVELNVSSLDVYRIYTFSNKLKSFDTLRDINLVQVWYDDFIQNSELNVVDVL